MITNNMDMALPLAVWAVHDEYDYVHIPNYISVTSLMRPIRQIALSGRVPKELQKDPDVQDYIARALGHSVHAAIERAWTVGYEASLKKLGYGDNVISRIRINPKKEELDNNPDIIAIYMEQRELREIDGYVIGGKYDLVAGGMVQDYKTTSTYSWKKTDKDTDYCIQGSLYRWLNPEKITEDEIQINFIFTDWQKGNAKSSPDYPQSRVMSRRIQLMSIEDTEKWVRNRLKLIQANKAAPQEDLVECTDKELWKSDPVFKYYSDPAKVGGRATRNFDTPAEANAFQREKGKGVVITVPGEAKRCAYCDAAPICEQFKRMNQ